MSEQQNLVIFFALLFLASLHSLFGKNLPRVIWVLSLVSAASCGLFFSLQIMKPPKSGFEAGVFALMALGIILFSRLLRRNHDR